MPQLCTVCHHPEHQRIDLDIVRGEMSNRRIAAQYRLTEQAIRRHRLDHLPGKLIKGSEASRQSKAIDVWAELRRCLGRANKLLDACDEWLTDPDDPGAYDLDARASEISVIYEDHKDKGYENDSHKIRQSLL